MKKSTNCKVISCFEIKKRRVIKLHKQHHARFVNGYRKAGYQSKQPVEIVPFDEMREKKERGKKEIEELVLMICNAYTTLINKYAVEYFVKLRIKWPMDFVEMNCKRVLKYLRQGNVLKEEIIEHCSIIKEMSPDYLWNYCMHNEDPNDYFKPFPSLQK